MTGVAPGRVNLIGEHTDYNHGLCLPIALTHVTAAAAVPRDDDELHIWSLILGRGTSISLDDLAPGHPQGWSGYVAGTIWALREAGHPVRGMDMVIGSDVPVGAGLSSSAALECATAAAADAAFSLGLLSDDDGRRTLVQACRRAENEIVGAPTGGLDQTAAMFARAGHALLIDFHGDSLRHIPFDPESSGLELLAIDTHSHHSHADGEYGRRRRECEQAAAVLGVRSLREATAADLEGMTDGELRRRARHVVTENGRVEEAVAALEAADFAALGRLFDASHASLRDDYEVSCRELDTACEAALAAGALGARMTGGGFGGSVIALVRASEVRSVRKSVRGAFTAAGFAEPEFFVANPGQGAWAE